MNTVSYFYGLITGIYFLFCIQAFLLRKKDAPYIEAFGYVMGISLILVTIQIFVFDYSIDVYLSYPLTGICLDMLVLPFYLLELSCLTYQNVELMSWTRRWLQVGLMEVPIVAVLILSFYYTGDPLVVAVDVMYCVYGLTIVFFGYFRIRKYEKGLEMVSADEHQSAKWMRYILLFNTLQILVYILYPTLLQTVFAVLYVSFLLAHGFFVFRQTPTDTTFLQLYEQQATEALENLENVTKNLKKRVDRDSFVASFRVREPNFERMLRKLTDTKLTSRDVYLAMLIASGTKIPDIAFFLAISPTSVEVARYRLRNKLKLEKGTNLNNVLKSLLQNKEAAAD